MSTGFLHLHSYLPYIFLTLLVITFLISLVQWQQSKPSSALAFKLAKVTFILGHLQLTIGILLLFMGEKAKAIFSQEGAMKTIMGDAGLRLSFVEHPITMLLAITLLTIGYVKAKKSEGVDRAKKIALFFGFGFVLMLTRIPWDAWLN
jgi:hypothetical protein